MQVEALWARLRADAGGLVVAVVTDARDGRVRMVGYMNRDALAATVASGRVTFWSRSRARLWEKGESSGHSLVLRSLRVDCDGDALLVEVDARGPTCHTGATSCFFRPVQPDATGEWVERAPDDGPPPPAFRATFDTILERQAGRGSTQREGRSYVRDLLDAGHQRIAAKVLEETQELVHALAHESDERVAAEAGDLLFHVWVALAHRGIDLDAIAEVLRARHGRSGIDEKAGREST